jgi:hypothetical protein
MHLGPAELLGLLALGVAVVTLPTVFQMIWGRPYLTFETRVLADGDSTLLVCSVFNRAIENRLLVRCGIRRETALVTCSMKTSDVATGQFLHPSIVTPKSWDSDEKLVHQELPAGFLPINIVMVRAWSDDGATTWDDDGNPIAIHPGTYEIQAAFWVGERVFKFQRLFVITANNARHSYWVG